MKARLKAAPQDTQEIANTLSSLGWALTDLEKPHEAEPILRGAMAIHRKVLPKGHWGTANSESLLGACLAKQGRFAEAGPMLLASYEVIASAPGVPPIRVRQALGRIVVLYEAWGKPEEAANWRARGMDLNFPADPFAP